MDTNSLLHHHEQEIIHQQLEDFLEHRPNRESLIGKHILKEIPIAPSLVQISKQLEWNKRSCSLQRKIYNRPSLSILVEKGIVKDRVENFHEAASFLEEKLAHRPPLNELISKHILNQRQVAPSIKTIQQKLFSS